MEAKKHYLVRVDADTYDKLKKLAEADKRSTTQYINLVLKDVAGALSNTAGVK